MKAQRSSSQSNSQTEVTKSSSSIDHLKGSQSYQEERKFMFSQLHKKLKGIIKVNKEVEDFTPIRHVNLLKTTEGMYIAVSRYTQTPIMCDISIAHLRTRIQDYIEESLENISQTDKK